MSYKNQRDSAEVLVIQYLKKNRDLFIRHPELLDQLNFPIKLQGIDKIVDINAYRSKKITK